MEGPKLHALLVGINKYKAPIRSLEGCEKDVFNTAAFLKLQSHFGKDNVHLKRLLNEEATKGSIIREFRSLFENANEKDTVLFYFSGHGCREDADRSIWFKDDKYLEGLVCYNESTIEESVLADKEIRFLLKEQLTAFSNGVPHVVFIFDSCHSGDSTRALIPVNDGSRSVDRILPQRPWNGFIFSRVWETQDIFLEKGGMEVLLAEQPYVTLTACEDRQKARETFLKDNNFKTGVFTTYLLDVLNKYQGQLHYYDLYKRIKNYTRYSFKQIPQLYVPSVWSKLSFAGFLGNPNYQDQPVIGNLIYNEQAKWLLDMGALQGISKQNSTVEIIIQDDHKISAKIVKVEPDISLVKVETEDQGKLDTSKEYRCLVTGFQSAPLNLFINDEEGDEAQKEQLQQLLSEQISNLNVVEESQNAELTLNLCRGEYRLTRPEDRYRPLVAPLVVEDTTAKDQLVNYLRQIAHWTFVKELQSDAPNQEVFETGPPLEIQWATQGVDGQFEVVESAKKDHIDLTTGKNTGGKIRLKIKNNFSRRLHYRLLLLSNDFTVSSQYVNKAPGWIEPGETIEVFTLNFFLEPHIKVFNWPESRSIVKFIVSTEDNISIDGLVLEDGLPLPYPLKDVVRSATGEGKGIGPSEEVLEVKQGWITQTVTVNVINPFYNQISSKDLHEMLEDAYLQEYILGLYVDWDPETNEFKLKEGIAWDEEGKGIFWDLSLKIANTIAKRLRRDDFFRRMNRYPDRRLMVSEGDSWFQHPLLGETIDHLSVKYNIYSTGSAGDEIIQYAPKREWIKAIEFLEKRFDRLPEYLLISGGGNDILGKQFADFLVRGLEGHPPVSDYFNPKFQQRIDSIMSTYASIFEEMQERWPQIKILTHCYDYIPSKDRGKKGWINRYLIDANILEESDRSKVVKYMIDLFNDRLKEVVARYPQVKMINTRDSVPPGEWSDEIHPTRKGFAFVAERFASMIDQEALI